MAKEDKCEHMPLWKIFLEVMAVVVLVVYTTFAGFQWEAMHDAMLVDQRAWVSVVAPTDIPSQDSSVRASIQITNTGKTPAKDVEGDIDAIVLKKGEGPSFDFNSGHPREHLYAGALFPNAPINIVIPVVQHGSQPAEPIVPTPELRRDIANGESFVIFYGKISYVDVFGRAHWTTFCTGSGTAIQSADLKKCISHNDIDKNQ
jgi:hypothetical protein